MTTEKKSLHSAINKARMEPKRTIPYAYDIKPPTLIPGVVPKGRQAPVMAMDYNAYAFNQSNGLAAGGGFPGYQYLSQLATRAEFRSFASTLSTELTRKWIEFTSKKDDDSSSAEKIKAIEEEFNRLKVQEVIQRAAEHDCYFGRAQILLDFRGHDVKTPLILDPRTIKAKSLERVTTVEAMWTSPSAYNAIDPSQPDFYRPSSWFMLGKEIHATRLMTIITRPLPDILKPAFNFSGMSLSQLAEPYVDNWLRTRQGVSDLINNFSTTILSTSMSQVLQGADDGAGILQRADLFTAMRSNKGLMLLDKDTEELGQVNTPLSGLHELQAQSQEHMCSVSHIPAVILTGISPSGLNATSEGEIKTFYDWISAQQSAYWRDPIDTIFKVVQLSLFGAIDPDLDFSFVPLYQMTEEQLANIRKTNVDAGVALINSGVIDPSEERERLARDAASGYESLDLSVEIVPPTPDPVPGEEDPTLDLPAQDADFKESEHPRAPDGKFGSGGGSSGGGRAKPPKDKFAKGGKDDKGYERQAGLDSSEREIEQKFYDLIDKNKDKLINAYRAKHGNTIDPDLVKGLSPEFYKNQDLARAVHEPSSYLAKELYAQLLAEKAESGDDSPTLFSAGGGGSGKGSTRAVGEGALGAKPDGLFYDSTLSSPASAIKRIDQALASTTGPVAIAYTNTPLSDALKMNALRGRTVSIDTLLHAHVGASNTIRELNEHYANDPRVQIAVVNNKFGEGQSLGSVADVFTYNPFEMRENMARQAKAMLDAGEIDDRKYKLLIK